MASYKLIENAKTLRGLPNVDHSKESIAIKIPNEDKKQPGLKDTITYGQLHDLVEDTATGLVETAGIETGDVISIVLPNCVEFVLSFLAVPWARAVSAPLNPNYTEKEYKFYMEDNKSKCVLIPKEGLPAAEMAAKELGISVYFVRWKSNKSCGDGGSVQVSLKNGEETVTDVDCPETKRVKMVFAPCPNDVALFLHTSGTTARPKGVPLSHANLLASMNNISQTYSLTPRDTVLLIMPLFHVHGLMSGLLSTLATGGCVILPQQAKFSASFFWHNAKVGEATWVTCVPTIYQVLLLKYEKDYPSKNPPTFRFVRSCSSALAPSILKEIESKFNAPCVEAYAMTEASHQMTSNPIEGVRKPGTVGKGTGVDVAILDKKNEVVTKPHTEGEVCVRGKNVTKGYIGVKPEVNEEAFAGGWFHTGDQGKLDEDGYLQLTGRIKELINRAGEKISPLEVDAAMLRHPAVAEAVSFSKPDNLYGEVVAAAIVLKEGCKLDEKELQDFLVDKLTKFKIPVKVFFDTKLPKTPTGKIQRRIVAAHFLK